MPEEGRTHTGYDFRRIKRKSGKWRPLYTPQQQKRKKLLGKLEQVFASYQSRPIREVIEIINPKLRATAIIFALEMQPGTSAIYAGG